MNIKEYMNKFDKEFNTDIFGTVSNNNYPMLEFAFNNLGEKLYVTDEKSLNIIRQKASISEKLDATLNEEQKSLIDKYFDLDAEALVDVHKQLLIFGYCLCFEQLKEMQALKTN